MPTIFRRTALVLAAIGLTACSRPEPLAANTVENEVEVQAAAPANATHAVEAPAARPPAGEPEALNNDRTPVSEAPFTEKSAQGAANVVQTYYALLEAGRYGDAWRLWSGGGEASGRTAAEFAGDFRRYREYHAQIGAPGSLEGAAGSIYVDVPVQVYGRLSSGERFERRGTVTLRRVNDVPGSTLEQRRWHISRIELEPAG